MKNALSFAVALGLVAGVASVASAAELTINGDARWRGVYHVNYSDATDHRDATVADPGTYQDTVQEMDQRYRFNADLKINDAVKVNTRIVLRDSIFGNNYGDGVGFTTDRANMVINTLGGTWTLGRQDASWGNKFLAWGVSVDRLKATYKSGDFTYGGYLQKDVEGGYANGDGDQDTWGAFGVGKAGDTTYGVLLNYIKSDANDVEYNQGNGTVLRREKGDTGYLIDPYFVTKVGPATVLGELVYKGGDVVKKANFDKAPFGGFVAAAVDMAPVTVKGLVAYYKNNNGASVGGGARDCDNDFAPSLLIGTCNETAMIDFGSTTNPVGDAAHANDSTYLVGAGVDFKASDKITVGALVGYLSASKYFDPNGDGNLQKAHLTEVDMTASYELAQNATYKFGIAYGKPKNFSPADDTIWAIGNSVEVAW